MQQIDGYEFDDEEIHVLAEALTMYAAYNKQCVLPMLVGDESDVEEVRSEANTAQRLARHFFEADEGERWEEISAQFASVHGRPMDFSDVSQFDWYEFQNGQV